jgi:hypothetical protein
VGSERNRRDGVVLFGSQVEPLDFNLWSHEQAVLFSITYQPAIQGYLLEDLQGQVSVRKKVVCLYPGLVVRLGGSALQVQQQPAGLELLFRSGPASGRTVALEHKKTIGRDELCSVVILDETLSKLHATIEKRLDWVLIDEGSRNGLWAHYPSFQVRDGMRFKQGDWLFEAEVVQRD